ncbi:IclR family transcriptional regulator [Modestobacter versicolor]|uniref:IclR family transcriptional regulator n=1 Tax=Modestobacter versicolor TaxID=429133 RepID=UPI0034DFD2C8
MRNDDKEPLVQPVQSVDRAAQILEILARRGEVGVTEIGADLGVHKSTASRLLATLEGRGLVEQARARGTYRLGVGLIRLAGTGAAQLDVVQAARQVCAELAADLGETVNVAVLDEGAAMNVSQARGSAAVAVQNWVGRRTPLHATSSGKVLLAYAPDDVRRDLAGQPLARCTPATITDHRALAAELAAVRARGWGATEGELEVGLNGVAAPVRTAAGEVVAALSVSGPAYRLGADRFPAVAEQLVAAATEAGALLG